MQERERKRRKRLALFLIIFTALFIAAGLAVAVIVPVVISVNNRNEQINNNTTTTTGTMMNFTSTSSSGASTSILPSTTSTSVTSTVVTSTSTTTIGTTTPGLPLSMTCPSNFMGSIGNGIPDPASVSSEPVFTGGSSCGTLGYNFVDGTPTDKKKKRSEDVNVTNIESFNGTTSRYEFHMMGNANHFDPVFANTTVETLSKKKKSWTFPNSWTQRTDSSVTNVLFTEIPVTQSYSANIVTDGTTTYRSMSYNGNIMQKPYYDATGWTNLDPTTAFPMGNNCRRINFQDNNFIQLSMVRDDEADRLIIVYFRQTVPNTMCLIRSNSFDLQTDGAMGWEISFGTIFTSINRLTLAKWGDHYNVAFSDFSGGRLQEMWTLDRDAVLSGAAIVPICKVPEFSSGIFKSGTTPIHQGYSSRVGANAFTAAPCGIFAQPRVVNPGNGLTMQRCLSVNYTTCDIATFASQTTFSTTWDVEPGSCPASDSCIPMPSLLSTIQLDPHRHFVQFAYHNSAARGELVAWSMTANANGVDRSRIVWGYGNFDGLGFSGTPPQFYESAVDHLWGSKPAITPGGAFVLGFMRGGTVNVAYREMAYRLRSDPAGQLRDGNRFLLSPPNVNSYTPRSQYAPFFTDIAVRPQTDHEWSVYGSTFLDDSTCGMTITACAQFASIEVRVQREEVVRTFTSTTTEPVSAQCPVNTCMQTISLESPSGGLTSTWIPDLP